MLQDIEAGRAPEIDALVGSVVELGRLTQTPTPHIDTTYALVKLLAQTMQSRADKKAVLFPQRSLNGRDKIRLRDDANQGLMAVDHRQVVVPLAVKHLHQI
jgi:hypothetical protein